MNVTQFADITHAQQVIGAWRTDYNEARPHGALGHLTPKEFVDFRQAHHPKKRRNSTDDCLQLGPRSPRLHDEIRAAMEAAREPGM